MKKKLLFLFLISMNIYGQSKVIQKYDSVKTHIPGTKIYITKPASFTLSKTYDGLESGENTITFQKIVLGDYKSFEKTITTELLSKSKGKIIDYHKLKIDNYEGTFILEEHAEYTSLQLFFGDERLLFFVRAAIKDSKAKIIEEIKSSLLSIEFKEETSLFPFHKATFTIDDSNNQYKFSREISGIYMFTKNGVKRSISEEGTESYSIDQLEFEVDNITPKFVFEYKMNTSYFYQKIEHQGRIVTNRKKINGSDCYEEEMIGTLNGINTKFTITAIIKGRSALVIETFSKVNDTITQMEFEKLTKSISIK